MSQGLGRLKANTENENIFRWRLHLFKFFDECPWHFRLCRLVLVVIYGDLFRRHDISGWGKAFWVIGLVVFSYLGILAYLITQGRGMVERNAQQAQQAREELRRVVGFSVADEISKLDQLKNAGSITDAEFQRLRAKLV